MRWGPDAWLRAQEVRTRLLTQTLETRRREDSQSWLHLGKLRLKMKGLDQVT